MSRIIFVNSPLTLEERYGVSSQSGGQTPPLGLAHLTAVTRNNGYDTEIIDAAIMSMSYERLIDILIQKKPNYIGITAATVAIHNAAKVAKLLKENNDEIVTIIGGPHLTALPEETMERFPEFDVGVIGEGEVTVLELLRNLDTNRNLEGVKGLVIRRRGKIRRNLPRPYISNLDELPFPAWDLLPDLSRFYCPPVHTLKRIPAALLVTSRGCPGQCIFCDRSVFGNNCRAYSAEYTLALIRDLYYNYGIREIQIRDDNFTAYRKRLINLCNLLKQERLNLSWSCAGRVDMVTPEILNLMREAGCWQIWYGIESGSQKILDILKKNTTLKQIRDCLKWTKKAGISPSGFFMIGNPGETEETMQETLKLLREVELDDFHISFCTPFPGSELYRIANKYGNFNNNWRKMTGWHPVFVPYGLSSQKIVSYSKKAFKQFYFRPKTFLLYLRRIRSFKHLLISLRGVKALIEFLMRKERNSDV